MLKTFKELLEIDQVVGALYKKNENLRESKFGYAYNRFHAKNLEPLMKELNEKLTDVRIDNALEDPITKAILREEKSPRGYAYSKEGEKKVFLEEKRLFNDFDTKEVEVIPYIVAEVPEMSEDQAEILRGCLI